MSEKNFSTALVNEICPVCAKKEEMIVLNTRLTESEAKKVKDLHGKTVGIKDEPCKQCQEYMAQGIIVIGFDESESEGAKSSLDLYRTGHLAVVREEWFADKPEFDISKRAIFIPYQIGMQIGFFQEINTEENEG